MVTKPENMDRVAWLLSVAGFVPFAALALGFLLLDDGPLSGLTFDLFKTYAAIILSFLGGIRWGLALLNGEEHKTSLTLSVAPALLGWFAIVLPDLWCVAALAAAFAIQGIWDAIYIDHGHAPPWFASLRTTLTLLVVSAHLLVLYALW